MFGMGSIFFLCSDDQVVFLFMLILKSEFDESDFLLWMSESEIFEQLGGRVA